MTRKKAFNWTIMFGLLAAFTVMNVGGLFRSPVYAAMAKMQQDGNNSNKNGFVVVSDVEHTRGFLKHFARLVGQGLVCEIDETQLAGLTAMYATTQETVSVGSEEVEVVTVTDDRNLKSKDIRVYLESTSSGELHCQVVKEKNFFYLLFSAHTS